MHPSHRLWCLALSCVVLAAVTVSSCTRSAPVRDEKQTARDAYADGYAKGRAVRESRGKGASIAEVVWGGCTRRALDAGRLAEADRGAWVGGCLDGVSEFAEDPPAGRVTVRTQEKGLLPEFREWLGEDDRALATHVSAITVVELGTSDFDVELTTDYRPSAADRFDAEEMSAEFVEWWDGDDGDGKAQNLVVRGSHGEKIAARRL
ncbi:hypothetical protein [Streptomyces laculatispora]|uniref:hypothetical protein n=1 Tax=Streptomyces laculatispora TaxID=887464 RepID=UPI001A949F0A|nr:hypothetical protein [Streptomyces laculatispora]MBO0913179.1 hypothetical protein [Streptomyces laculatispora]